MLYEVKVNGKHYNYYTSRMVAKIVAVKLFEEYDCVEIVTYTEVSSAYIVL